MRVREKRYKTLFDRPLFKLVGGLVTLVLLLGLFLLSVTHKVDMTIVLIIPGILMLIWGGMKRRMFWLLWLIPTAVYAFVAVALGRVAWLVVATTYAYWLVSVVLCLSMALCPSREQKLYMMEKQERIKNEQKHSSDSEHFFLQHDPALNALLDSLGEQIPQDHT